MHYSNMNILGISAFYHNSAAALLSNGIIVAAAEEERFTRIKNDSCFPTNSIESCLKIAKLTYADLDYVIFYDKPFIKFERLLETYLAYAPRGISSFLKTMPLWLKEKLFQKEIIIRKLNDACSNIDWKKKLLFSEHHLSHAASAFFPSPFEEALILTVDGVGEWATTTVAIGRKNKIEPIKEIHFPHSLGLLYSAFTQYLGFKVNSGEYKIMGLAPYGKPKYAQIILDNIIEIKKDGSFKLNMKYFNYHLGTTMVSKNFINLWGVPIRQPEDKLNQFHMDLAASIQSVLEQVVLKITTFAVHETGIKNLCLAGGVALNCVANSKIANTKLFHDIWIQPAAGDSGGALGAALAAYHIYFKKERQVNLQGNDKMQGAYLGPEFCDKSVKKILERLGAKFSYLDDTAIIEQATQDLIAEKALGWMQGRMEFGPRSLGNRSILADARSPKMQSILNLKIKFRESFRPFAPSVLSEKCSEWFEFDKPAPYMLFVANVKKEKRPNNKSIIPAVTHLDHSARLQTVHKDTNPKYHALISRFNELTGCPILVNTSFNVRGEPIVCTPEDAFNCFMGTNMDSLIIGNYYLCKEQQSSKLKLDYKNKYEAD